MLAGETLGRDGCECAVMVQVSWKAIPGVREEAAMLMREAARSMVAEAGTIVICWFQA